MATKFEEVTVVLENDGDFYRQFIKADTLGAQRYAVSKYFRKCFPDETCTPTRVDRLYNYFHERWIADNVLKVSLPTSFTPSDLVIKADGHSIVGAIMPAKKLIDTIHYVNGVDVRTLTDDQLLALVRDREAEIAKFQGVRQMPARLKKRVDELQAELDQLVAFLDNLDAPANP